MRDQVADPRYPDLVGIGDGPLVRCKVTEMVATMVPTTRREAPGYDTVYDQVEQRRIRYELPSGAEQRESTALHEAIRAKLDSMWEGHSGFDSCTDCEGDCYCQTCPTAVQALIAALNVGNGPTVEAIAKELNVSLTG